MRKDLFVAALVLAVTVMAFAGSLSRRVGFLLLSLALASMLLLSLHRGGLLP
jgi:hypothetical protein